MELCKASINAVIRIKTLQTEVIQGAFCNRRYIVYNIVATLWNPNYQVQTWLIWNIWYGLLKWPLADLSDVIHGDFMLTFSSFFEFLFNFWPHSSEKSHLKWARNRLETDVCVASQQAADPEVIQSYVKKVSSERALGDVALLFLRKTVLKRCALFLNLNTYLSDCNVIKQDLSSTFLGLFCAKSFLWEHMVAVWTDWRWMSLT